MTLASLSTYFYGSVDKVLLNSGAHHHSLVVPYFMPVKIHFNHTGWLESHSLQWHQTHDI